MTSGFSHTDSTGTEWTDLKENTTKTTQYDCYWVTFNFRKQDFASLRRTMFVAQALQRTITNDNATYLIEWFVYMT